MTKRITKVVSWRRLSAKLIEIEKLAKKRAANQARLLKQIKKATSRTEAIIQYQISDEEGEPEETLVISLEGLSRATDVPAVVVLLLAPLISCPWFFTELMIKQQLLSKHNIQYIELKIGKHNVTLIKCIQGSYFPFRTHISLLSDKISKLENI